ncbi:asparagine synthase-related protein [Phytohabitans flavus]|uniref:asparagine synthase-related protein n=1 Tax=Phytohabitans flavus TaxID=1076124 RepID=UPI0036339082
MDVAEPAKVPGGDPVEAMAALLRGNVERCLDEHPETVFELSGGFDSRLAFAALPAARRAGVRTLTLSAPGRADPVIAGELAAHFRTEHQVIDLTKLGDLTPEAAHELVDASAVRHDTVGNPVALGVLDWVESQVPPGVRITGQGGEMARGSYHMGQQQHDAPNTELVDRLARWWFVTNDATTADALVPDFAASARDDATAAIRRAFEGYHTDWLTAIDEFFLQERVHRWVGINFTGACLDRMIVGPYLDPRFLALARSVAPTSRSGSGYSARVLERLDPWLANARLATGVRPKHLPAGTCRSSSPSTRSASTPSAAWRRSTSSPAARPPPPSAPRYSPTLSSATGASSRSSSSPCSAPASSARTGSPGCCPASTARTPPRSASWPTSRSPSASPSPPDPDPVARAATGHGTGRICSAPYGKRPRDPHFSLIGLVVECRLCVRGEKAPLQGKFSRRTPQPLTDQGI